MYLLSIFVRPAPSTELVLAPSVAFQVANVLVAAFPQRQMTSFAALSPGCNATVLPRSLALVADWFANVIEIVPVPTVTESTYLPLILVAVSSPASALLDGQMPVCEKLSATDAFAALARFSDSVTCERMR